MDDEMRARACLCLERVELLLLLSERGTLPC